MLPNWFVLPNLFVLQIIFINHDEENEARHQSVANPHLKMSDNNQFVGGSFGYSQICNFSQRRKAIRIHKAIHRNLYRPGGRLGTKTGKAHIRAVGHDS